MPSVFCYKRQMKSMDTQTLNTHFNLGPVHVGQRTKGRKTNKHSITQHQADGALLLQAAVTDKHTKLNNTPGILNLATQKDMLGLHWPYKRG